MKSSLAALFGGVAAAFGAAAWWEWRSGRKINTEPIQRTVESVTETAHAIAAIDINTVGREQLMSLPGMSDEIADRIIENRPYRNKLDLVARLIVPQDVYDGLKHALHVRGANDGVKVAA